MQLPDISPHLAASLAVNVTLVIVLVVSWLRRRAADLRAAQLQGEVGAWRRFSITPAKRALPPLPKFPDRPLPPLQPQPAPVVFPPPLPPELRDSGTRRKDWRDSHLETQARPEPPFDRRRTQVWKRE